VTGIVEDTLNRVWVPQSKTVILGRELLPVNVERVVYWLDPLERQVYWLERPVNWLDGKKGNNCAWLSFLLSRLLVLNSSSTRGHHVFNEAAAKRLTFSWETVGSLLSAKWRRIAAIEASSQPFLHCCASTGHVQPFFTIKGICFSRKNFSTASAVRVSYA
jgi:hypothetical protein